MVYVLLVCLVLQGEKPKSDNELMYRLDVRQLKELMGESGSINDVTELWNAKFNISITIDQAAFQKAGVNNIKETTVKFPKVQLTCPLDLYFQFILDQLKFDAALVFRDGKYMIVPGKPVYVDESKDSWIPKQLQVKTNDYKNGLTAQTLQTAVLQMANSAQFTIYVRNKAFGRDPMSQSVKLKAMPNATYEAVLDALLKQVNAKALIRPNYILIIPRSAEVSKK